VKYIFIAPWKIPKNSNLFNFYDEFTNRISKFINCEFIWAQSALTEKDAIQFYTKEITKITPEKPICFAFDENGKTFDSDKFSRELKQQEINAEKVVLFCFGGAYGLPKELTNLVRIKLISLSSLTFSHELAFCVALEQIYRARCIMENHPYHHGEKSPLAKQFKS
jgi:23S rRNA (pseudouridine1915-N3)-methyltransferase